MSSGVGSRDFMQGISQSSAYSALDSKKRIEALAQQVVNTVAPGDRAEYLEYMRFAAQRIQDKQSLLYLSKLLGDVSKDERKAAFYEILSFKISDSSLESIISRSDSLKEVKKMAILALEVDAWSYVHLKMPMGVLRDPFIYVVHQFKAFTQDGYCLGNIASILLNVPEYDRPSVVEYMKSALTKVNMEKLKHSEKKDSEDAVQKLVDLWGEIPPGQFLPMIQWMEFLLEGKERVEWLSNIAKALVEMKCDRVQAIFYVRELVQGMTGTEGIATILEHYEAAHSKIRSPEDLFRFQSTLSLAKKFVAAVHNNKDKAEIFAAIMRCENGSIEKLTLFKSEFLRFVSSSSDPAKVLTDLLLIPLEKFSRSFMRGEEFLARLGLKDLKLISKTLSSWVHLSDKEFDSIVTVLKELKQVTEEMSPNEVKNLFWKLVDTSPEERAQMVRNAQGIDQLFSQFNLN